MRTQEETEALHEKVENGKATEELWKNIASLEAIVCIDVLGGMQKH